MTKRRAELDVQDRAALESHPLYLEHVGNGNQYSEIINAQLDGSKKETGKLVAQQRGLILNLKSVAQELMSRRDELVERVCLQDIAAQRYDSQMQAEIKRLNMYVAEADARQTQFEIASAERDRAVKELASVKALHAGQREADAKDAELQMAQLKLKIAQLEGEVQREHANFLAETNKIISLEVSLDEQVISTPTPRHTASTTSISVFLNLHPSPSCRLVFVPRCHSCLSNLQGKNPPPPLLEIWKRLLGVCKSDRWRERGMRLVGGRERQRSDLIKQTDGERGG